MSGIVWLASYPKSGNTWFRAFISNLVGDANKEININHMKTDGIFSSRPMLDSLTGVETSNLTMDEIDRLRPRAYNHLARVSKKQLFIKVHDAYTYLPDGTPLLGTENAKAIYILRNPLDVVVSFANYASKSFDRIIDDMGNLNNAFCDKENLLPKQTRQKLQLWSAHVESWANAAELPVHLIRYEDMKRNPLEIFTNAVRFIGLDYSEEQIKQAIELSSFDKLKAMEDSDGFKEKPYSVASFFRAGKVGDWRNHLSDEQRDRIIADHKDVMRTYGYLDEDGNPI